MIRVPHWNKFAFFDDVGYEPHEGQLPVHRSRAPRRVMICGVRFGKTRCAAMEGWAAALSPIPEGSIGWVVAPTYDLADKVYRELVAGISNHMPHRLIGRPNETLRRIRITNLAGGVSEIQAKTADNPTSLLGEGLDWLIVDEAARVKRSVWDGHLSQRLIDKRGWALLISTPKGKGWLYDLFRLGMGSDPDHEAWGVSHNAGLASWTNPHLPRDYIERERGRIPDRVFRQEYGAEFIDGSGSVFRNVRECATAQGADPAPGESYYAGLDLAKVTDYTVLSVLNMEREVVHWDRFHRLDWSIQMQRVKAASERYNYASVLVDSTGAGEPIYESMCRADLVVEPYTFTSASKAALINNLALMFEQRSIKIPRPDLFPELVDELEAFQFSVTEKGNVRMEAPSGQHDDCVIGLALSAWRLRDGDPAGFTLELI